ncbi:28S ribosomal protein S22, mitochondrial [Thelohanellus kitauei]|uniref:28S ribosomal protein S22, mitochondrial n=1 Tax=Thelohanellus kitauei TaxID=669202 RepID=A0A0C2MJD5_THEKT|nr:28S ribosomal protein S22, mitochondrial [Thelohanellus kitauei]
MFSSYNRISGVFVQIFKRTRTSKRNKPPTRVKLDPYTPLSQEVSQAWKGFDSYGAGEPLKDYYNEDLQAIFKKLIGRNPKFLKNINMARRPIVADYKLVHADKIPQLNAEIDEMLDRFLETIPMYTRRKPNLNVIIQKSPELKGYDSSRYVFTDVSPSKTSKDRTILVRHQDGSLKLAPWDVRERINIVYFGSDSDMYPPPKFISSEKLLKEALKLDKHLYILNYALSTCSPDSPNYIKVLEVIFRDIIFKKKYSLIEMTPFFGPFIYFACMDGKYRAVVRYYNSLIKSEMSSDPLQRPEILNHLEMTDLMKIYSILKPDSQTAEAIITSMEEASKIFEIEMRLVKIEPQNGCI